MGVEGVAEVGEARVTKATRRAPSVFGLITRLSRFIILPGRLLRYYILDKVESPLSLTSTFTTNTRNSKLTIGGNKFTPGRVWLPIQS